MKYSLQLLAIYLLLIPGLVNAQEQWTRYTTENGLINNNVNAVIFDRLGNIWIGADRNGVSKFDGTKWSYFADSDTLTGSAINVIKMDSKGNLWFGTGFYRLLGGGLTKFDGENWTRYFNTSGINNLTIADIAIDSLDNLWLAYGSMGGGSADIGVSVFNENILHRYEKKDGLISNTVWAIAIDHEGNKWFGTDDGVSRFDDTIWTSYTSDDGLAANPIHALAVDLEGNIWAGSRGTGVSKFDGTKWTTFTAQNGLSGNLISSIAVDLQGVIWIGTEGGGVSKFDGSTWESYTTDNGLSNNYVNHVYVDPFGNRWFSTESGVDELHTNIPTGLLDQEAGLPHEFLLQQNYPNPFNPATTIEYSIYRAGEVSLTIYNTAGQLVRNLVHEVQKEGKYAVNWDGKNNHAGVVSSGIYFYRMEVNSGYAETRKMLLLK